ncbi:MAG TPA: polysaccharide biosynthesis tyrosine autokinase [Actinomycetota bacterium]|jgi:receptor protein-tyrosine kinase|nr:polysaccharide biosynthesis tyrosine autokinase [Actinomycetota bacterium]
MEFDLLRYVRLFLKRKWWFLTGFALAIAAGMLITAATTPVYQANTRLFVGQRQVPLEQLTKGLAVSNLSEDLVRSYAQIIASRSIAQRAIADGGLSQTPSEIVAHLQAQPVVDTQVIKVAYQSSDPVVAQRVVNAVTRAFVAELDEFGAQDGGTPALRVSIIDPAVVPSVPIDPQPVRNMALAAALGLLAGAALALIVDQIDQSVKSREELEQLGLPVLGSIPTMETGGQEVHLERDSQGIGGESFRKLRTSIGFLGVESPLRVILVTSSLPQEGKTTLSLNLASAYALGGFRTLLVEADLRRPTLHRVFGMYGTRGLTTVIVGGVSLEEAILNTETRNLSVLMAGAIPPNPVELLGSEQMIDVVNRLRMMFDVVIVDSPPVVPVADPATLASLSDGVVVVARSGKTDRRRIVDTVEIVKRAGGRFLGVALNFLLPGETTYDYQYYYYGQRPSKSPDGGRTLERHG